MMIHPKVLIFLIYWKKLSHLEQRNLICHIVVRCHQEGCISKELFIQQRKHKQYNIEC